jgi:antitoxin component of RelBE/YafQ-DinJ toxin-antitoxin module
MLADMARKVTLNLRIDPELKAATERAVDDAGQTFTSLIELLLTRHCKEVGALPSDWIPGKRRKRPGRTDDYL